MSAKFPHVFTDENQELKKQIGCMTGIFQIFDRQHLVSGRRHGHKKLTSGHALSISANLRAEQGIGSPQLVLEKNLSKSSSENKRISMESSRTSFSSSSGSLFSSLDGNRTTQSEVLSLDKTIFPYKYSNNSPNMMNSDTDGRPPRHETQTARRSLDFRDVVKDSINRDSHILPVKAPPREELKSYGSSCIDSPRPMQLSKLMDGSYGIGIDGKSEDQPWDFSEFGKSPRSSFEANDHKFSCDAREISRQSLDSRENRKSNFRLQELPRLSLDSREDSVWNSNFEPKLSSILKDLDRKDVNQRDSTASSLYQELVSPKRSASIIAKLMGLEAVPSSSIVTQDPKPLRDFLGNKEEQISRSPHRSLEDPVACLIKDPDSIIKPISNLRVPIETAPWKQQRVPQKAKFKHREATVKQQSQSVLSEREKRLKELEFQQSNKDLRAVKQILDAMEALGTNKNDQTIGEGNKKNVTSHSTLPKGGRNLGTFESPIVIIKPAHSVKRSGVLDGTSGVMLQTHATMDKKKACTINRAARELSDKRTGNRTEGNRSNKNRLRAVMASSRPQQSPIENGGSSLKSSCSLSPRLRQKMVEAEKSRPPLPSSDSSKPRRSSSNRVALESISPRVELRQKQDNEGRLSNNSEIRKLSDPSDKNSQQSGSNIILASQMGTEVTSAYRSADKSVTLQQGNRSPSARAARKAAAAEKQKKASNYLSEEISILATADHEEPSPICALDASFCQDDLPPSPLKKISNAPKDEKTQTSGSSTSEINKQQPQSINCLVQKLGELSSTKDEFSTTDHIDFLYETQDPNHRYVTEILLTSGLLFKDLSSGSLCPTPIKLHPSSHPINPDLFLILEQTKTKSETINQTHRKLVFDIVNEILIQKFELPGYVRPRKCVHELPSGQKLLKELCVEIGKLQAEKHGENFNDEIKTSEGWGDSNNELPGLVLEIERLIFKDLIDEVVAGEVAPCTLQCKSSRR